MKSARRVLFAWTPPTMAGDIDIGVLVNHSSARNRGDCRFEG
jgi:hypothetical protein